ncbi:MAG: preprotein translocase subunit SecG [Chthoniobacterales bacterium]|nr:preprotein translocase subunit SecG [Chthoniobacterales bacterium]
MSVLISIIVAFHVLVCLLMVVVVLMQRPKNEGLGAAFGGGMTENIFGAQTTHVLQKFTVWLGVVFFAITLLLAVIYAKRGSGETAIQKELLGGPTVPAAAPKAAAAPSPAAKNDATSTVIPATGGTVVTTEPVAAEPMIPPTEAPMATEPVAVPDAAPSAPNPPAPAGN